MTYDALYDGQPHWFAVTVDADGNRVTYIDGERAEEN